MRRFARLPAPVVVAVAVAGCGTTQHATQSTTTTTSTLATATSTAPATTTSPQTPSSSGPGALQAEANAAAAGDIPDNQVFLVFHNRPAGYSIKYPEGWAQRGSGSSVVFRDKNNIVRIAVSRGATPTAATIRDDLSHVKGVKLRDAPQAIALPVGHAFKVSYSTVSAPSAVTGKRVTLVVDRYYVWRGGRRAVIDLGTPVGVDNVDAYRLMSESFQWR
jgi:hypothetical protein